jgi:hypothetical protein
VFISNCLYVYTSHPVESLIIKNVISMATTTKTTIECKVLSIQEELGTSNTGWYLKLSLQKVFLRTSNVSVLIKFT